MATAKGLSKDAKNGLLAPYDSWRNRIAVWRFVKDIPYESNHPTRTLLKETEFKLSELKTKEIISCWGMKDFCFHPEFLKKWKNILPNLKSYEFEDSGHYILEDNYSDCVKKIKPFLIS